MKAPAFWWRPPGLAAALLAPAAAVYGRVAATRMARPGQRASVPVVCIGNLTVGGSGKTPTALAVAAMLRAEGFRPAFLTRGYGGRLVGPVRVDPAVHDARDVGDEALLLAATAPTIVARDRAAGAAFAGPNDADVVVMDDGLQNPGLVKDLALAVFDGAVGTGNDRVLPAGPLRAPLDVQWPLVDAVLIVGAGGAGSRVTAQAEARALPVLHGRLVADEPAIWAGRRLLAFAGIGRPSKFFSTLREVGAEVVIARAFPDHHVYGSREIGGLLDDAARHGLALVTTAKDRARLSTSLPAVAFVEVFRVRLVVDEVEILHGLIRALRRT